jgi:precorrin-3B C17-methyltransferase
MMSKGKLHVVGFGPGGKDDMTFRAARAIEEADVVTGYTAYVNLMKDIFPDKEFKATGMMKEVERCRMAIEDAMSGKDVAMISSGDSGIYGMAGIIYQLAEEMNADIDIDCVPGVTAASSSAAILGAPLMHDLAIISLSDLMTPLDLIMKRVDCAAQSDMIITLYNPKSKGRTEYLDQARNIILKHRDGDTPVGIVRNAGRDGETHWITTLESLDDSKVDMFCMVIIGNSQTYVSNDRMITPRGYPVGGKREE